MEIPGFGYWILDKYLIAVQDFGLFAYPKPKAFTSFFLSHGAAIYAGMTERELTSWVGWLENNDGLLSVQEVNQMYRLYGICIDIYTKFDKVTDTICIEYCINPFVWTGLSTCQWYLTPPYATPHNWHLTWLHPEASDEHDLYRQAKRLWTLALTYWPLGSWTWSGITVPSCKPWRSLFQHFSMKLLVGTYAPFAGGS